MGRSLRGGSDSVLLRSHRPDSDTMGLVIYFEAASTISLINIMVVVSIFLTGAMLLALIK